MIYTSAFTDFIPIVSLLIYIFGLGFYWMSAFFVLYHLIRFGIGTKPKRLSFIFLLGSIVLSVVITLLFVNLNLGVLMDPLI